MTDNFGQDPDRVQFRRGKYGRPQGWTAWYENSAGMWIIGTVALLVVLSLFGVFDWFWTAIGA